MRSNRETIVDVKTTMRRFAFLLLVGCSLQCWLCSPAAAGDLLGSQGFESPGWESQFTGQGTWGDNITRAAHEPYSGSYCLRWNQYGPPNGRNDPITGLPGIGNSLLDWRGGTDIVGQTPHEMYFSMRFRHDDYSNSAGFGDSARKLFYLVDQAYNVGAMYLKFQLGTVRPHMSYGNGAYNENWAYDNWGYNNMFFQPSGISASLNGDWRRCEIYFNYDQHYFMLWFDGVLMLPADWGSNLTYWERFPADAAAGRIKYDPSLNLHFKGFQIGYFAHTFDCVNCNDDSEYYCGFQIDDLEVWNGMPGPGGEDTQAPSISADEPEFVPYEFNPDFIENYVNVTGSAQDNNYVSQVSWSNNLGGQGVAQGTTNWSVSDIELYGGLNVLTFTASDVAGNQSSVQVEVPWTDMSQPGSPVHQ